MDDCDRAFWLGETGTGQRHLEEWGLESLRWGDLRPKPAPVLVADQRFQLGGMIPDGKSVVIADHLRDGEVYLTAREIILNQASWQGMIATIERQQYCRDVVRGIVETGLRRELAWLREAGHEV